MCLKKASASIDTFIRLHLNSVKMKGTLSISSRSSEYIVLTVLFAPHPAPLKDEKSWVPMINLDAFLIESRSRGLFTHHTYLLRKTGRSVSLAIR